jgi:hypothetical protein
MAGDARKVVAVRLNEAELAQLDALVAAEPQPKNWWDPQPSRSSVIRAAIAARHTALQGRNTKRDPRRNTSARAKRNTRRSRK